MEPLTKVRGCDKGGSTGFKVCKVGGCKVGKRSSFVRAKRGKESKCSRVRVVKGCRLEASHTVNNEKVQVW